MDQPHCADRTGGAPASTEVPAGELPRTGLPALWARIQRIAAASGCPKRTAAAFALGVFLSFSPLLGLQTVIGLGLAFVLRMSKAAVFAGLWANLPWVMLPWYTLTTAGGAFLLQIPLSPRLGADLAGVMEHPVYRSIFWERLAEVAGPFVWAFLLGPTLGAVIVGAATYLALLRVLQARGAV